MDQEKREAGGAWGVLVPLAATAPTGAICCHAAMLPAVKLRPAESQTMSMLHSAPAQDWSASQVIMTPVIYSRGSTLVQRSGLLLGDT